MNTKQIQLSAVAIALTILVSAAAPALADVDVNYQWTAPTTGSPAVSYVVQLSSDGGTWTTIANVSSPQYTLDATFGVSHEIRVAGVDSQGRQGIGSEASDPLTPDAGSPGQPGKPIII